MTVVIKTPGAVGGGLWYNFTVGRLQSLDGIAASAYLDSEDQFTQSAAAFGFAIPADATITSLAVSGRYKFDAEASAARFLTLSPSYGGHGYGAQASVELAADEAASEWTIVEGGATDNLPTVAQLNSPDFTIAVDAWRSRGNLSASNTWVYLDYITLTVEYDEYVPPPPNTDAPTVGTWSIIHISYTTASGGGVVTDAGGAPVTDRGICVDTEPNPRTPSFDAGVGTGEFTCAMTGLTSSVRYYVAAFATNQYGTAYGEDVTFDTPRDIPTVGTWSILDISYTTAMGGGVVVSAGGAAVTYRGLCVGTEPNPRTPSFSEGGGTGEFPCFITGLAPGTRYYVAAFAQNSYGTAYGADVEFSTPQGTPVLGTWSILAITGTTGSGGGNVTSAGAAAVTYRGIGVSTSPSPRTPSVSGGSGTGEFTCVMTGLTPGTRYFVAAFAQNAYGVTWGADVTFVTHGVPAIATAGIYDITATTATGGGNVSSGNGDAVTSRGVCWSVEDDPTPAANIIPAMTSATAPSGVASESGHYGSYAAWMAFNHTNPAGGASGTWVAPAGTTGWIGYQFPVAHTVTRYAVTSRNEAAPNVQAPKTWTFHGSNNGTNWVTLDTQTNVTDWATTPNLRKVFNLANTTAYLYYRMDITASNGGTTGVGELEMMEAADDTLDGSGSGVFVSHLTGLTEGVTYNVRAYAVNAVGVAYGAAVVFTATADAPPVEPPLGPPRDPSKNLLFDGTLELMVGTLDVAFAATQVKFSNSNPGGFGNLSFRLPADAPYAAFDAQVVKGAAVTMKHGLVGFVATLFEGEVTSDVSHATIAGGKAYYDVTCAGIWWAAGQRKDFSMVTGDDDYGQWYARDDNAKAFQVSTDGCLEIRLEAGQSAAAGDSASLYYWLGKGMGDPEASIDFLFGLLGLNVTGTNWTASVHSAPTPWGPWTACAGWTDGTTTGLAQCISALGDNPQALKLQLSTTSAVDAIAADRFVRLDKMAVGSDVSANSLSAVSAANPTVVTSTSAHELRSGDRVFITQSSASTPTISGWRTVTVTNATHFTVPVAVTTAGGAGTFYKATRIDQALVEIAVTPGLATLASLQPGGIGNLNWGLVVRPHASRAGGIDLLAATNVAPFDYGFWENSTFYCQDRPVAIRALHDYLIDSSLPGIDFDVRKATEDSPTTVKVLYKFRAADGETSPYPDGTALAVYRTAAGYGGPAVSANIIPAMTSNSAPSGVASASAEAVPAWGAFNHTATPGAGDRWATTAASGWLQYQFAAAKVITQYAITTQGNSDGPWSPKTWTFKGSNNGSTWTTLDTQTNVTDWAAWRAYRRLFKFSNTTAYLYYRLDVSAANIAEAVYYVSVGELEMMETVYTAPPVWANASPVLDVWNEWADLSLTTAQAGDLGDQILAWLDVNAYQGGGSIAPATVPLRAEGTKPAAYIRGGDYIEDSNLDTGPLMITGFSMDADRGVATIAIGENRRAFVERLTPDKA